MLTTPTLLFPVLVVVIALIPPPPLLLPVAMVMKHVDRRMHLRPQWTFCLQYGEAAYSRKLRKVVADWVVGLAGDHRPVERIEEVLLLQRIREACSVSVLYLGVGCKCIYTLRVLQYLDKMW
jgi:hypothetical protein